MVFFIILGIISILFSTINQINGNLEVNITSEEFIMYDFIKNHSLEGWIEQSDTVRQVGMSKAALVMQETQLFSRAVLFTLLNPQSNGACFAGVRRFKNFNLQKYNYISLKARGQGDNYNYKIILRHKNLNDEPYPTYEQFFTAPKDKFDTISLLLSEFKPYYRGKELNDTEPLDKSFVTSFGIQIYGGVYLPVKQFGASSLEIEWIKATA